MPRDSSTAIICASLPLVAAFVAVFAVLSIANSMNTHTEHHLVVDAIRNEQQSSAPESAPVSPSSRRATQSIAAISPAAATTAAPAAAATTSAPAAATAAAPAAATTAAPAAAPSSASARTSTDTKAPIRLDGTLASALRLAAPPHRFLLLTFGNIQFRDFLLNFCHFAAKAGTSHLVGAVDVASFELLAKRGTPVYKTPLAFESYALDGANSHASQSWKRFAAMRTGEVARVVRLGYTVLHSDTDIVWLRDPMPYIMCTPPARTGEHADASAFPCADLARADVAVSSDNMGPRRALDGRAAYHAAGTFNSGILLFRPTAAGTKFVNAWHENVANPPRGSRFVGRTSDQQVFNAMVRMERQWPGVVARRDTWLMGRLHADWMGGDANFTLGALPLPLFANGHGYFVQRAHARLGHAPFAVHATYTLDYHDAHAKAQRFREAGLWASDPPQYYEGKFLAVNASVPPAVSAALARFAAAGEPPNNIGTHMAALTAYLAELRDALALATALGRTLVLPRWTCYCDKLWAGSDDLLRMKCMYPGSQDDNFLPIEPCPMDHVLSPHVWGNGLGGAGRVAFRDPAFLTSPRLPAATRASVVDVHIVERAAYDALPPAGRSRKLPSGQSAAAARRMLEADAATRDAAIVRLPHTRDLLCGVGGPKETRAFNRMSKPLLRAPPWCTRCDGGCRKTLSKWLTPQQISSARGGWGGGEFCLNTPTPPLFEVGGCAALRRAG